MSDGFPTTTLAMVSALLTFEHWAEAQETLSFFLRRLLVTSALSRGLKLSGLRFLIPVFIRVLTTVKPAQDTCRAGC